VEEGLTIGGHTLREYLEATNHAQAYSYLVALAEGSAPLTLQTVLELHRLVMSNLATSAGQFRRVQVYIRGANVTPPPPHLVEPMLAEWLAWFTTGPGLAYEPLVRFAISHHDFEVVHPFEDGNGRTGRLLLNLMLLREGYPPALILREWRGRYLQALDRATLSGNYSPIANLVGQAVEGGLDLYLAACEEFPQEEYELLSTLAAKTNFSTDYLGWLIRQGRLGAAKRRGRWYTTEGEIARYQQQVAAGLVPTGRPSRSKPKSAEDSQNDKKK
jgi:Fic family protein